MWLNGVVEIDKPQQAHAFLLSVFKVMLALSHVQQRPNAPFYFAIDLWAFHTDKLLTYALFTHKVTNAWLSMPLHSVPLSE